MYANEILSQAVGGRIRTLRLEKKMSQDEFGALVNTDRTYINKIENGACNLTVCKLCSICEKIDITLHDFFNAEAFNEFFTETGEG
ncbi:MAG: helix-turn-helix domain-containing protein [Oscillospiraceae bacterium]|nr:helix-turn-helix domain-containing protein [Oscillospiraceae bacterium]